MAFTCRASLLNHAGVICGSFQTELFDSHPLCSFCLGLDTCILIDAKMALDSHWKVKAWNYPKCCNIIMSRLVVISLIYKHNKEALEDEEVVHHYIKGLSKFIKDSKEVHRWVRVYVKWDG